MFELDTKCPFPLPKKQVPQLTAEEKEEIKKTIFNGWLKRAEMENDTPDKAEWTELDEKKIPKFVSRLVRLHYGVAASSLSVERKKEILQHTYIVQQVDDDLGRETKDILQKVEKAAAEQKSEADAVQEAGGTEIAQVMLQKVVLAARKKNWTEYIGVKKIEGDLSIV